VAVLICLLQDTAIWLAASSGLDSPVVGFGGLLACTYRRPMTVVGRACLTNADADTFLLD
jgi:hypothetical protein